MSHDIASDLHDIRSDRIRSDIPWYQIEFDPIWHHVISNRYDIRWISDRIGFDLISISHGFAATCTELCGKHALAAHLCSTLLDSERVWIPSDIMWYQVRIRSEPIWSNVSWYKVRLIGSDIAWHQIESDRSDIGSDPHDVRSDWIWCDISWYRSGSDLIWYPDRIRSDPASRDRAGGPPRPRRPGYRL